MHIIYVLEYLLDSTKSEFCYPREHFSFLLCLRPRVISAVLPVLSELVVFLMILLLFVKLLELRRLNAAEFLSL